HGFSVSAGGGTVDQGIFTARYGGGNGDSLDYRGYAKGFTRAAQFHPDDRPYDDWRLGKFGFRLDSSKSRDTLTLEGDIYKGGTGESTFVGSFTPPAQIELQGTDRVS